MKALIFSGMGRNKEAMTQIKMTLFKNLTNFTCWHVMGIINRKEKDYDSARRAYINALKYNPENESVTRDLCQLQLHLRDFDGFKETRRQMLVRDPSSKEVWAAYATACFLSKDYNTTVSTCESIVKFDDNDDKKKMSPVTKMEILILRVRAHEALEQYSEALDFMN